MSSSFEQPNNPGRQLLIPDEKPVLEAITESAKDSKMSYGSPAFKKELKQLRDLLQTAIELEHSTIPPYLCALYSIRGGTNKIAADIIKSVVLEEMLHMIMAANLLNAVGGKPQIGDGERNDKGKFIPDYPTSMPGKIDPNLVIGLGCFSVESIDTFIQIEHPAKEADKNCAKIRKAGGFCTIGEFYKKLLWDLVELEKVAQKTGKTIFTGDVALQVSSENYYGAGGKLITVRNLSDAENVINEIVGQGEGDLGSIFDDPTKDPLRDFLLFGPSITEYAHYFRYKEVKYGRYYSVTDSAHRDSPNHGLPTGETFEVDWNSVYNMRPNPKMKDYKDNPALYEKSLEFNKTYSRLLDNINAACNGKQEVLKNGIMLMYELRNKAIELMMIPVSGDQTAGPSFEYVKS